MPALLTASIRLCVMIQKARGIPECLLHLILCKNACVCEALITGLLARLTAVCLEIADTWLKPSCGRGGASPLAKTLFFWDKAGKYLNHNL